MKVRCGGECPLIKASLIKLTRGKYAIVDSEDYDMASRFKWMAGERPNGRYYASRTFRENGKRKSMMMHRLIIGYSGGLDVDHINRNGIDNRKENLRVCSRSENNRNRISQENSSSKHKGVYWHKQISRWIAQIRHCGKTRYIGSYKVESDAAMAYNEVASKVFGEYARLNNV